jgi:hypothetical protein
MTVEAPVARWAKVWKEAGDASACQRAACLRFSAEVRRLWPCVSV